MPESSTGGEPAKPPGKPTERLAALEFLKRHWLYVVAFWAICAWLGWATLMVTQLFAKLAAGAKHGNLAAIDLSAFWSTARMILHGQGARVYDFAALHATQHYAVNPLGTEFPWLYPPSAMPFIVAWGVLPFATTYVLQILVSTLVLAVALRLHCRRDPALVLLTVFSPATLIVLMTGQLTLLLAAALLIAMALVARGRPGTAGIPVALFVLKPHMALALLPALLVGRKWRVVTAALAASLALALVPTAIWGVGIWPAWLRTVGHYSATFGDRNMASWYSLLLQAGLGQGPALAIHVAIAVPVMLTTGWIWAREGVPFDLRLAVLFCATALLPPSTWYYDDLFALIGAMFLVRRGARRRDWALYFAIWVAAAAASPLSAYVSSALLFAPLWSVAFVQVALRAWGMRTATADGGDVPATGAAAEPYATRRKRTQSTASAVSE